MAYGPGYSIEGRDGARYVDRILRGGRPAEIPVEQPTKFELLVNLKTARRLGITVPESVLNQADVVIQ
jgi:putative ABC transport system substrate-binding protein